MRYVYLASDENGTRTAEGVIEAESPQEARRRLREMGLFPLRLAPAARRRRQRRPGSGDLVLFMEQFATLIGAGVSLVQALNTLSLQSPHPTLRHAAQQVRARIEGGSGLAEAMGEFPEAFPPIVVRMVAAAELSGSLEETLRRVARYLDDAFELQQKIRSALTYPIFAIVIVLLAVVALLVVVVPVFQKLYANAGADLPGITLALLAVSDAVRRYAPVIVLGLALLVWGFGRVRASPAGGYLIDRAFLGLPLFGPIAHKSGLARFARTLATLYASGINILAALDAARDLAGNRYIAALIDEVQERISKGESLSQALAHEPEVFVPMFTRMVSIGEESGELDRMLDQVGHHLEREVDHTTKRLSSMIEPVMTVVLGVIVLFVALALYLPLFELPGKVMGR
ncbi:type II secretion system F family protein [Oceanithermus sp.]|uniref:type II secretion system F family protein n=1 Tax=Oceanithermus sp. TaxID=2268145 RepID=UPI00257D78AB|nr:type II secretion system F family protein [Oceanithermus sp.]